MNDRERLEAVVDRIRSLAGLDEERFQRLTAELDRPEGRFGYDEEGRLKVALFGAKSYDIESFERRNADRFAIHPIEASLSVATAPAAEGHKAVCIFVNDTCDAKVVKILAGLGVELVALRCAGFNNVDLAACRKRGLSVVRVPEYSPYAVAEHSVGLMLMLNRGLHRAYERNRAGYFVLEGLTGFDMRGKTVGVVGTGKIGRCTADILLGFGCRVVAFDKYPNQEFSRREGVEYVPLERLWADSDIVSLHVPLLPETYHLVNAETIAQMKPGVMLINTSRGGLVDTPALVEGLKSGKVGTAGLDVYEEEAGIFFNDMSSQVLSDDVLARLMTFQNVVVTSHQAFLTHEALRNIADATLASIAEFEGGKRGAELTHALRES